MTRPDAGAEPGLDFARQKVVTLLVPFTVICALIADRAQLGVATGGHGSLPILAIAAPLVAFATVARLGQSRTLPFLTRPVFLVAVLPYLVITALLPVLGVIFNGYPDRTLLSATDASTAFSFMIIGAAMREQSKPVLGRWIFIAIVAQVAYSLGQAIYLAHGPGWELFAPFHAWDLAGRDLTTLVQARSSGLYVNPNELGFWAAAGVVLSWTLLRGRMRVAGVGLSVLTLLLSESRGAGVALAVALAVAAVDAYRRDGGISKGALQSSLRIAIGGVASIAAAFALAPSGSLGSRLQSLVDVGTQGAQSDPNLAGRLDYWVEVTVLNGQYPWGTFGSPEVLLGSAIDSSWFRSFAQGSVPYVAILALLMVAAIALPRSTFNRPLRLVAVVVAVAGITQTPLSYPAIVLFWVLLGADLQWTPPERKLTGPRAWRRGAVRT